MTQSPLQHRIGRYRFKLFYRIGDRNYPASVIDGLFQEVTGTYHLDFECQNDSSKSYSRVRLSDVSFHASTTANFKPASQPDLSASEK